MQASPIDYLIETLVRSLAPDVACLRERYLLRQSLQALVRQARVEQVVVMRADALRLAGCDRFGEKGPQQACSDERGIAIDDPVRQRA